MRINTKDRRRRKGQGGLYKRKTSNNWILRYKNADGAVVQESSGTSDENIAKTMLKQKMARVELGQYVQPKTQNITVTQLYESFLSHAQMSHYRDVYNIEIRWKLHLEPVFGKMKAIHVNKDKLTEYVVKRQREGASDATINREISTLRRAFYLNEENIGKMPKFPQLKESNARTGFVEDRQYQGLADACGKEGLYLRSMFEVAYNFGWRSGALKKFQVWQINLFDSPTLTITAEQAKNGERLTVPITKGGTLYRLLAACAAGKGPEAPLFSRLMKKGHKAVNTFEKAWKKACTAAGVPSLLFHDLRRTAVRNMERSGIPRKVAMSITGHKTESVYRRYHIVTNDDVQAAVMKIENRKHAPDCILTAFNETQSKGHGKAPESTYLIDKAV